SLPPALGNPMGAHSLTLVPSPCPPPPAPTPPHRAIDDNRLSGPIPPALGNLPSLAALAVVVLLFASLRSWLLFPVCWFQWPSLPCHTSHSSVSLLSRVLSYPIIYPTLSRTCSYLASNSLEGPIPASFKRLKSLMYL
ncbi:unnamed protein product, partial [Closterium sp. NIES-53]